MRKRTYSVLFVAMIMTTAGMMTSCQNGINEKTDIKQVDTPIVSPDNAVQVPTDTTVKKDTTKTTTMPDNTNQKKPLTLIIDNLGSPTAPVEVSIYGKDNKFPKENGQMKKYRFTPTGNTLTATITDIEYGEYAVATYQDLDADGKIATNVIGIPTDPYGFSKNYVPKIKAPAFKDCAFAYDDKSESIKIKMIKK